MNLKGSDFMKEFYKIVTDATTLVKTRADYQRIEFPAEVVARACTKARLDNILEHVSNRGIVV